MNNLDPQILDALRHLASLINAQPMTSGSEPVADVISAHLGCDARTLPPLTHAAMPHRFVDYDIALDELAAADPGARLIGVAGESRFHLEFADILASTEPRFGVGEPDLKALATGPETERACVTYGIRLMTWEGRPIALLQRGAMPQYGLEEPRFEFLGTDRDSLGRLIRAIEQLSLERSVLRGQVLSLSGSGFEPGMQGLVFVPRPDVAAEDVILPEGTLERIRGHVIGVDAQKDFLTQHGQHLKRGVLLYGPPGSGKTHTVRHLIGATPEHTVLLLAGEALGNITLVSKLARALQPSIVAMEDCDLIAGERDMYGMKPLLFAVLDAMDGLDDDADVTFLLTTNRVDVMESALTQRPGRVDLAAEIPLPTAEGRERLLRLYLPEGFSDSAIVRAAEETEGTTASFAKELARRTVLVAATAGIEPTDDHLTAATDQALADRAALQEALGSANHDDDGYEAGGFDYEPLGDCC